MAHWIDEISLAWASLSEVNDTHGWRTIPIVLTVPLELQAGRRAPDNAEAILVGLPQIVLHSIDNLPEGIGFELEPIPSQGDGKTWVALTRKSAGKEELFKHMVADVIGALVDAVSAGANNKSIFSTFIGRVRAWQEFMRKGMVVLNPEAEIGLVGELTVLRALIDSEVSLTYAINSWVGPLDALQDFELGTGAFEVKSTISSKGFPAKIGSLEQLDDAIRQPLFIVAVRLKQTNTGKSLPDLIDEMKCIVTGEEEAEHLFAERVLAAGYIDYDSERYLRRFDLAEMRVIEVDDNFPRLTQNNVPVGITKANYEINIEKILGKKIEIGETLKKLGILKR